VPCGDAKTSSYSAIILMPRPPSHSHARQISSQRIGLLHKTARSPEPLMRAELFGSVVERARGLGPDCKGGSGGGAFSKTCVGKSARRYRP
jgi:hypothetical protein